MRIESKHISAHVVRLPFKAIIKPVLTGNLRNEQGKNKDEPLREIYEIYKEDTLEFIGIIDDYKEQYLNEKNNGAR